MGIRIVNPWRRMCMLLNVPPPPPYPLTGPPMIDVGP